MNADELSAAASGTTALKTAVTTGIGGFFLTMTPLDFVGLLGVLASIVAAVATVYYKRKAYQIDRQKADDAHAESLQRQKLNDIEAQIKRDLMLRSAGTD